jgi:hypothetical protein
LDEGARGVKPEAHATSMKKGARSHDFAQSILAISFAAARRDVQACDFIPVDIQKSAMADALLNLAPEVRCRFHEQ